MDAPVVMDDGTWSNTLRDLLPAVQASVEDEVIRGLATREVLALLQQMDGRQAVIARGYFLDEKPQQVLAREFGVSQTMVSREVKRALEQLRATFPYGGDVL